MIIDKLLQVSDKQTMTNGGPSTDVIDFGQENPNTGMDDRTKMVITVNEAVTSASNSTKVTFHIQDSADNATFDTVVSSSAILKDKLGAGAQIVLHMPTRLRRYCRVFYAVTFAPLTTGKFSAQIVTGIQQNDSYPDSPRIA